MHPLLYVEQAAFVVKVDGALVQIVEAQDDVVSNSHPSR